jgi:hypothetical protein
MSPHDDRCDWTDAFIAEISEVARRHPDQTSVEQNLVGLAFSGGGIRSATFGLGVLEGLKRFGLLDRIHYLSTVSGGGYVGAWLSANCKRHPGWLAPAANWEDSVRHLRRYSNYLSPTVGFFSADTWAMFTVWIRNTLLVQFTVILAIALTLLLPRPLFEGFRHWPEVGHLRWTTIALFILGVVGIAGNERRLTGRGDVWILQARNWRGSLAVTTLCVLAAWRLGVYFQFDPFTDAEVDHRLAVPIAMLLVAAGFLFQPAAVKLVSLFWPGNEPPEQINYTQAWVQRAVVLPMMVTAYLVGAILWGQTQSGGLREVNSYGGLFMTAWKYWPFPLSVVFASLWLLSFCSIRPQDVNGRLAAVIAPIAAVLVLHALLCAIMLVLHEWAKNPGDGAWKAFVWTPPLVLYAFSLSIVMLIGMMGRESTDGVREWWSRLGAWIGIYAFVWMVIALAAVYGPKWVAQVTQTHPWKLLSVGAGWLGTTAAGLFAGRSNSTGSGSKKGENNRILEVVAVVAPFVFIAGLLIAVSTAIDKVVRINSGQDWSNIGGTHADPSLFLMISLAMWGACLVALLVMAARVDINEFSLNAFYRNRLVRCYLGATRFRPGERTPQNFTGFDDDDDIALADLSSGGPLHLVNCALNLGGSSDLALHTRHSATFTLTPLQCGSSYQSKDQSGLKRELGYIPTSIYGGKVGSITLGQAISVSGAAASPNMGYHTSPVVAFLLTLFNVRLGAWFPNPRLSGTKYASPRFNLTYLLAELFGGADDTSRFLMISDGGHFENLAAYELVKRRCRVIIISDGECDPELKFEGLGTLIRMCEVDFGARITLDVRSIRPGSGSIWSSNRCAVGRIAYGPGSPAEGILIYLKASLTGHEDTAVLQYKASHPAFPHETTGDQFYGEDQFESYRTLGQEVASRTFEAVKDETDVVMLATKLLDIWSPTLAQLERFTAHTARLTELWARLGSTPGLQSLDEELVGGAWPKDQPETFRSAFYICSEMIQLMENVYLDLDLEATWDHPDNRGWRAMFTIWARSPLIRRTWLMTSEIYGVRFRYFCARHLDLQTDPKSSDKRAGQVRSEPGTTL